MLRTTVCVESRLNNDKPVYSSRRCVYKNTRVVHKCIRRPEKGESRRELGYSSLHEGGVLLLGHVLYVQRPRVSCNFAWISTIFPISKILSLNPIVYRGICNIYFSSSIGIAERSDVYARHAWAAVLLTGVFVDKTITVPTGRHTLWQCPVYATTRPREL